MLPNKTPWEPCTNAEVRSIVEALDKAQAMANIEGETYALTNKAGQWAVAPADRLLVFHQYERIQPEINK